MVGCAKMGMHFVGCAPKKYQPDEELVKQCREIAKETGAVIEFEEDPMTATKEADAIYTDVWVSMGEPDNPSNFPNFSFNVRKSARICVG